MLRNLIVVVFLFLIPAHCCYSDQNLGSLELSYMFFIQSEFRAELDLEEEQRQRMFQLQREWKTSLERRTLKSKQRISARRLAKATAEERFDAFVRHSAEMELVNNRFLAGIDEALDSGKKSKRCRQMLRQLYLRFGLYESYLRTLDWKPKEKEYVALHNGFIDFATLSDNQNEFSKFSVAVRWLVKEKICTEDECLEATGEWFSQKLPSAIPTNPLVGIEHDVFAAKLLKLPSVIAELEVSPREATKLSAIATDAKLRSSLAKPEDAASLASYKKEKVSLADQIDVASSKVLSEKERLRFNQLLFQRYLCTFQFKAAMKVAQQDFTESGIVPRSKATLYAEAAFENKVRQLNKAVAITANTLGQSRVRQSLGKLVLAESPLYKGEGNKDEYAELYRRYSKQLTYGGDRPRNVRRSSPVAK